MPTKDCDAHGWNFEPGDTCPVCDGMELERERIIGLLEENALINESDGEFFTGKQGKHSRTVGETLRHAILLINGEQDNPHYELPEELQDALDRLTIRKKPE